ncbi:nucleotide-binding protein [Reichenbachiella sp.]|uniref:nucleotide-binding protein n=1 Tax=Reichenbachiella sp. TaxID=2184521 RepID=UPI003297B4F6
MEKSKYYDLALFSADILKEAFEKGLSPYLPSDSLKKSFKLTNGNESWRYDSEGEFYSDYRKSHTNSSINKYVSEKIDISINYYKDLYSSVTVQATSRDEIENVFEIFEKNYESSTIPVIAEESDKPVVFIGHGGSMQWRDLKDHLTDKHDYKIESFESGARAGHTIRDILDEMATNSSFALLVMTAEDRTEDGTWRARQNVIHEVGLFQGSLGFSKAIVLLEEGAEEFSNLYGIQQIRFSKNKIKETFGEVLATLKREFNL